MTAAKMSYVHVLNLASETGCVGIEVRNDLAGELFDGENAAKAGVKARDKGLRLLALSEVSAFNDMSDRAYQDAKELAALANSCGAEAVSLIPRNDGKSTDTLERVRCLRETVIKLAPVLKEHSVLGYIEPLGFEESSLRYKSEVVDVLLELELTDRFQLVHDTFHHHLAGEESVFPEQTGMVHISGVVDKTLSTNNMRDEHRVLVDEQDMLNNIPQLRKLRSEGYSGPVSVEAFSSVVHELTNPQTALLDSFKYIESNMVSGQLH